MAKWCHRHLPQADITVVEINPHVIALRDRFYMPEMTGFVFFMKMALIMWPSHLGRRM